MKKSTYTCDCGCGATTDNPEGWFKLSQHEFAHHNDEPKIERELHFATLECVAKWTRLAADTAPSLKKSVHDLSPRGSVHSPKCPHLFV